MFDDVLSRLGVKSVNSGVYAGRWIEQPGGEMCVSLNPATGETLGQVVGASKASYGQVVASAAAIALTIRSCSSFSRNAFVRITPTNWSRRRHRRNCLRRHQTH